MSAQLKKLAQATGVIEVKFINDWTYHSGHGEVHCVTNVLRNLPADQRWWDE